MEFLSLAKKSRRWIGQEKIRGEELGNWNSPYALNMNKEEDMVKMGSQTYELASKLKHSSIIH